VLRGKHIVVTGASRGIGREIALEAARKGARVGINYLRGVAEARTVADEISRAGFLAPMLLGFDATRSNEIARGIEAFLNRFGRIDGWVNNAAVNIQGLLPVLSEEEIVEQIRSALLGPIFCSKAVIPRMMQNKGGSIVNIGSVVTEKVFRGQSVYAAAKGGLLSFTKALACEYGRKGIRVNCIQPGPVETRMFQRTKDLGGEEMLRQTPLGRYCPSGDVAYLAVFLLSDLSCSITGASINIDGGYTLT
jgi:3-oxoacyl-[acyl-carrier protein] reductase